MIAFSWHGFDQLSVANLYEILRLRSQIFVVEQHCVYQDLDNLDQRAMHLIGSGEREIITYLRMFSPENGSIIFGRVLTHPNYRNKGIAKQLMVQMMSDAKAWYPNARLECSAQYYLVKFYQSLGFDCVGEPYEEDGIPHIHMVQQI